ncbi:MAG: DUF3883 domain-containing protein [Acidobacteriota bacterium]
MDLLPKSLNLLKEYELEEIYLLNERQREINYRKFIGWFVFILFILVYAIVSFLTIKFIIIALGKTGEAFALCLAISPFFILLFLAPSIIDLYSKIFNYFFQKTKIYQLIKNLEDILIPIERQIEEEALDILDSIKTDAERRLSENGETNRYLRLKRNPSLYKYEIEKATKNYVLNQETLVIVNENIKYIKFNVEKQKYFERLQYRLEYENIKWVNTNSPIQRILEKFNKSKQNPSPINKGELNNSSTDSKGFNSESDKTKHNKSNSQTNKITADEILGRDQNKINKRSSKISNKETPKILSKTTESETSTQSEFDFDVFNINLRNLGEIPAKKNTLKYERIIKASPDFFQRIADKKLEIGMKGEFLVMDYERQRLMNEGEIPDERLEHSSVEIGDGLGYDIRSFEDGKEIYIEVKTTTGSFWSNLFFTENEFEKMNQYDEQYYLYRVCEFNVDTNSGELFIFKGKDFINSYFDFKSKMYVLTPK